jgi:hypothetical protein
MRDKLLIKNIELSINPQDPTAQDNLNRLQYIKNLSTLIQTINQPFVISIEAPWGNGKTTFIKMWQVFLENNGHTCIYFNAWKNDYVDDPLTAFIGQIDEMINNDSAEIYNNPKLKTAWRGVKDATGRILRFSIPTIISIATHGIVDSRSIDSGKIADEISKLFSEEAKREIENYEKHTEGLEAFHKELKAFTGELYRNLW